MDVVSLPSLKSITSINQYQIVQVNHSYCHVFWSMWTVKLLWKTIKIKQWLDHMHVYTLLRCSISLLTNIKYLGNLHWHVCSLLCIEITLFLHSNATKTCLSDVYLYHFFIPVWWCICLYNMHQYCNFL